MLALVRLLVHLGLQSLKAHRAKTLIVGGLMTFGSFLVVTSLALLTSIDKATRAAIVESVSGDIQIYDKNAKDKLALFGGFNFGTEELGDVPSFEKVKEVVEKVDNVKAVVPMGIVNGGFTTPGDLDRALGDLRDAARNNDQESLKLLGERVRGIAKVMQERQEKEAAISDNVTAAQKAAVTRAISDELQAELLRDPQATLDWIEAELAPFAETGQQSYLRMVGTDLDAFQKHFGRLKIVEGKMVPSGERGMIVGKMFLDRNLKLSVAMFLDYIDNELKKGQTIAGSTVVKELVGKVQRASGRIVYLVPPKDVAVVTADLQKALGQPATAALPELVKALFDLNDSNFAKHFKIFYDVVAPRIALYPFKVGDTITLTAFTKSGYLKSVNVKVYGVYTIEGLETSEIASALTMSDLITFRELYGRRTAALDAELAAMKASSGTKDIARADAEAALFGDDAPIEVKTVEAAAPSEPVLEKVERVESHTFDPKEANEGYVLSAAVLLKDPSQLYPSMMEIQKAVEPLSLQVVDWQQATGIVGQLTMVVSAVLLGAILILFIVTIVILNNSMVMATLERVGEFGTLRAIGAQRGFVNAMVIFETAVLGTLAGTLGAVLAIGFVTYLHGVGIPAPADLLQVVFGGPRLFPSVSAGNVVAGLIATLIVAVLATLYPARLATRVQPIVAMQGKE